MLKMNRRLVLAGISSIPFTASPALANQSFSSSADKIASLPQGKAIGRKTDGILSLKGIPFALPPVGPLRFRAPQPARSWKGLYDAREFGNAPLQANPPANLTARQYLGAEIGEDCLNLNIWAPSAPGNYPVYVWIHGGGNVMGAASQAPADGALFARHGIVCVTIGYRVGVLGFLELGGLLGEEWRGSGNNGLKDITAALQWIQDNIEAVGGDPDRVTIGGESAGGKNIISLLAASQAHGLFARAIVQSGAETIHSRETADNIALAAGLRLCENGQKPSDILTLPAQQILSLQKTVQSSFDRPFPFRAIVDGDFLPQSPIAAIRDGASADVPLLIGTNRDESILFRDRNLVGQPIAQKELANLDADIARPVFEKYKQAYPELSAEALRVRFLTAAEYWKSSMDIAKARAEKARAPTFIYRFDQEAEKGPFSGWAPHASELGYVWNKLDHPMARLFGTEKSADNMKLSSMMHRYWAAFIKDGKLDDSWPAFEASGAVMHFDKQSAMNILNSSELALWNK